MSSENDGHPPQIKAASPEEYAAFISQIELRQIWLTEAQVRNHAGPATPAEVTLSVGDTPAWYATEWGFCAESRYSVRVTSRDEILAAEIDVTFSVTYESPLPMTDALFALFGPINLPLNTWPYLREYLATMLGRMNWLPFALPALKRGIGPSSADGDSSSDSSEPTLPPLPAGSPTDDTDETDDVVRTNAAVAEKRLTAPRTRATGRQKKKNSLAE